MHLFYHPNIDDNKIELNEEESAHAIRVLRMHEGEILHVTDGRGTEAICKIEKADAKKCSLQIVERKIHDRYRPYYLHIALAPTKNRERTEWFVEKAVECGIDEITFMATQKSERSKINLERMQKIAVSAMKQSKQWHLPTIHQLTAFDTWLENNQSVHRYIAWCGVNSDTKQLSEAIRADAKNITIAIGPEGDFTAEEIQAAIQHHFVPVSLGKSILRTETAALYACMAIKTLLEK